MGKHNACRENSEASVAATSWEKAESCAASVASLLEERQRSTAQRISLAGEKVE